MTDQGEGSSDFRDMLGCEGCSEWGFDLGFVDRGARCCFRYCEHNQKSRPMEPEQIREKAHKPAVPCLSANSSPFLETRGLLEKWPFL